MFIIDIKILQRVIVSTFRTVFVRSDDPITVVFKELIYPIAFVCFKVAIEFLVDVDRYSWSRRCCNNFTLVRNAKLTGFRTVPSHITKVLMISIAVIIHFVLVTFLVQVLTRRVCTYGTGSWTMLLHELVILITFVTEVFPTWTSCAGVPATLVRSPCSRYRIRADVYRRAEITRSSAYLIHVISVSQLLAHSTYMPVITCCLASLVITGGPCLR